MANPKVRPFLHFYPEDSYPVLEEAQQGDRWLHELPADQTTPMAHISENDYFIYEPAMICNGQCCIPIRWFVRANVLFAKCWKLEAVNTEQSSGWRVIQSQDYEVPLCDFIKNFTDLQSDTVSLYDLPSPTSIIGMYISHGMLHDCYLTSVQAFSIPSVPNTPLGRLLIL